MPNMHSYLELICLHLLILQNVQENIFVRIFAYYRNYQFIVVGLFFYLIHEELYHRSPNYNKSKLFFSEPTFKRLFSFPILSLENKFIGEKNNEGIFINTCNIVAMLNNCPIIPSDLKLSVDIVSYHLLIRS
jgi:hypothetical protein